MRRRPAVLALALVWLARPALAAAVKAPHVSVDLVAEGKSLKPGETGWVGVRFTTDPGWHVYWRNPGDSGMPTSIAWKVPAGITVGELAWPRPDRILEGPLVSYGYEEGVLLMAPLTLPAARPTGGTVTLAARATWLVCKDTCIPGHADLTLTLPVGDGAAGPHAALFTRARARLPAPPPPTWRTAASVYGSTLTLVMAGASVQKSVQFFPLIPGQVDNAAPQRITRGRDGVSLVLPLSDQAKGAPAVLEGVLVAGDRAWTLAVPVGASAASTPAAPGTAAVPGTGEALRGFLWALLLAFAGGMILNLMPCVFPILSIKVLGFVRESAAHPREVRIHGLLYGAGVLVSFWALTSALLVLKSGGERLGWGFQLQSPSVIALLAATLFLLALNLFGVFEAGTTVARHAGAVRWGEGRSAAFFTGVLATFLATPCTAPFMGTAVGYAAIQPAHIGLAVFSALALGMAAPYVALSFVPALGRHLPRPGRWMETFKQVMAFPLLATVIWLIWVLGLQAGLAAVTQVLACLLVVALAAWLYGRWHTGTMRAVAGGLVVAALAAMLAVMRHPAPSPVAAMDGDWRPWSAAAVERETAAGRPVFVDFTAAWCLTCKVNELVALDTADGRAALKRHGVVMLKADWTNADPAIERALASFGRNGVPLYVLYPGRKGSAPRILPQILTAQSLATELDRLGSNP